MGKYIPRYEIDEELLKKLRSQGLSYRQISDYLEKENGIRVSYSTLCKRIKEITPKEDISEEEAKEMQKQERMLEERLKELREQGLTYREISEKLTAEGYKITLGLARTKIKQIYSKEEREEPKAKYKKSPQLAQISDEELLQLRKIGFGTGKIQQYYKEKGIKVSRQWVWIRVKALEEKAKEVSNAELLRLKQEGYTYQKIREHLQSKGIDMSLNTIRNRIIGICELKKIEVPKSKKHSRGQEKKEIPEDVLIKLSRSNWSYRKMAEYLRENGITEASYETIRNRIIEIRNQQNSTEKKSPSKGNEKLIEYILKLKDTKNANDEQIQTIAKLYGVNLKGTRINKPRLDEDEIEL